MCYTLIKHKHFDRTSFFHKFTLISFVGMHMLTHDCNLYLEGVTFLARLNDVRISD